MKLIKGQNKPINTITRDILIIKARKAMRLVRSGGHPGVLYKCPKCHSPVHTDVCTDCGYILTDG